MHGMKIGIPFQVIRIALFGSLLGFGLGVQGQLTVQGGFTGTQLVNTLLGGGVQASNIVMNCPGTSAGTFNGSSSNIGLNSGVLLTSGDINVAPGPNNSGSAGVDNLAAGDPLLTIQAGWQTYDACYLEFDLIPMCDTIGINYVFGSDEYPEWVGSQFNDAFGFFISGPGIAGTQNIAIIPGTAALVTINNVNQTSNSAYYISNSGTSVQYDGFTVPLQALAVVIPCSTYHLKLVIADAGDGIYDSGVFLESNGIGCISQQITLNASSGSISGQPYAIEGCVDALFEVKRSGNLSQPFTLNFNVGGTATNGTDFAAIPASVTFGIGVDSIGIPIQAIVDGLTEGLEQIYITISDTVCGTVYTDSAVILISDPPKAGFTAPAVCDGTPTPFTDASTFALGAIFSWLYDFDDAGATSGMQQPVHSFSGPGTYNVMQIVTSPDGCKDTIVQPVVVNAVPVPNFGFAGHCHTHPMQFTDSTTVPAGYSLSGWQWNFGDGSPSSILQNPSHQYANPGNYVVTLISTEAAGCQDTISLPVAIFPLPAPDFQFNVACVGDLTQFTDISSIIAGTINSWTWEFGDGGSGTIQNPSHLYNPWGTYNVQLTLVSDTGCIDSIAKNVAVNPIPFADFNYAGHCHTHATLFNDSSTASPGANLSGWQWNFGDGTPSVTQQNPSHTFANPGNYMVSVIATAQGGCQDTIALPVAIFPLPDPGFTHTEVCDGDTTFFTDASSIPVGFVAAWDWDFGDGGTSLAVNPVHRYGQWGTYNVELTLQSDQGCLDSVTIPVDVNPLPVPDFTTNRPCFPDSTIFTDLSTVPLGNLSGWSWDYGDGTTGTGIGPFHIYPNPGTYQVTLTVTTSEGCIAMITNETEVTPPAFSPQPVSDTVCPGFGATLLAGPHPENLTIMWFLGPDHPSPFFTGNVFYTPPIIWVNTWWIQGMDENGCLSTKVPVNASSYGYIGGRITVSSREVEIPNAIVEFIITGNEHDIISILWDFGDGSTSALIAPVHQYTAPGFYTITATYSDEFGCTETISYENWIEVTHSIRLYIPNAFTPNGDGMNDSWEIQHRLITAIHIMVYDRWGKLLYETRNPLFNWDGRDQDKGELQEGAYMYSIEATSYDGIVMRRTGSVTILR